MFGNPVLDEKGRGIRCFCGRWQDTEPDAPLICFDCGTDLTHWKDALQEERRKEVAANILPERMPETITGLTISHAITVDNIDNFGGDWLVCDAARVSTRGAKGAGVREVTERKDIKLLEDLIVGRHGGPFQHGGLTLYVEAPIFVFREWRTHSVINYQQDDDDRMRQNYYHDDSGYSEASARYRPLAPKFWVPAPDRPMIVRPDHKRMRPEYDEATPEQYRRVSAVLVEHYVATWQRYMYLIDGGVAPEVARAVLPSAIYSAMYVTMNPRSLMHFLSLRVHDEKSMFQTYPQREIEEAARFAEEIFEAFWPVTHRLFVEHGRVSP